MNYTASVSIDANEHRVVWVVLVYDQDGNRVESRPFRDKEDAMDYAESIDGVAEKQRIVE
jgi:hypothetical protein